MNRKNCEHCGGVGSYVCNNRLIVEFIGDMRIYKILLNPDVELKTWRLENYKNIFLQRAKEMLEQAKKEGYANAEIVMDTDCLKFHSDWSWLMPVVDKIETLMCFVNPDESYIVKIESLFTVILDGDREYLIETNGETKLQSVYNAVVEFIKWYGKKKEERE